MKCHKAPGKRKRLPPINNRRVSGDKIITGWGFKYFLSVALKLCRTSESAEAEEEKFVAVKLIVCLPWLLQGSADVTDQWQGWDHFCEPIREQLRNQSVSRGLQLFQTQTCNT